MGVTLEELLNGSGLGSPETLEKTASQDAQTDDADLASALRKLADAESLPISSDSSIKEAATKELIEKTAEIMVIKKTMEEIDKIASLGVEEDEHQKIATFIKAALDKGHSEEEIAVFLKTSGRAGRLLERAWMAVKRPLGRGAERYSGKVDMDELRLLRKTLVSGGPKEVERHLKNLEGTYGRPGVTSLLQKIQQEGTYLPYHATKYVPKASEKPLMSIKLPGGKEHEISAGTAKGVGLVGAGALGTGLAFRGRSGDKGGKGVVVVK